ncbi:hypothetical protein FA13DRAFT_1715787 [Coprinellus micaceus]|uniref:Uncharacterized protein n=1 Tax=Coprinellus micaceus TaxID=71717 RepID=A0A4Y7SM76_COPMI|nr:hypothetical protein FA13DRAFT_1715787 [Coprinellus micaceus]
MSISRGGPGPARMAIPLLPTIVEGEAVNHSTPANNPAILLLPISSHPPLKFQFTPVLDMRVLLQLRSLQLSHFHITGKDNWAFVVSGSPAAMKSWVAENMCMMRSRMNPLVWRYQFLLNLVLGAVIGTPMLIFKPPFPVTSLRWEKYLSLLVHALYDSLSRTVGWAASRLDPYICHGTVVGLEFLKWVRDDHDAHPAAKEKEECDHIHRKAPSLRSPHLCRVRWKLVNNSVCAVECRSLACTKRAATFEGGVHTQAGKMGSRGQKAPQRARLSGRFESGGVVHWTRRRGRLEKEQPQYE